MKGEMKPHLVLFESIRERGSRIQIGLEEVKWEVFVWRWWNSQIIITFVFREHEEYTNIVIVIH